MSATPTRQPLDPAITEDLIAALVRQFYTRIRQDPELGPIFAEAIGQDWGPHLRIMCDFWSSGMRMTGHYKGKPLQVHQGIRGIEPDHFILWLALFRETARVVCKPEVAGLFINKSERIAESLSLGLFYRPASRPAAGGPATKPR